MASTTLTVLEEHDSDDNHATAEQHSHSSGTPENNELVLSVRSAGEDDIQY